MCFFFLVFVVSISVQTPVLLGVSTDWGQDPVPQPSNSCERDLIRLLTHIMLHLSGLVSQLSVHGAETQGHQKIKSYLREARLHLSVGNWAQNAHVNAPICDFKSLSFENLIASLF